MASIQKVTNGWRAQISVKGARDDRTFTTKLMAQEWAVKREADLRSIDGRQGSKTHTVGDVLDEYQRKISPSKRGTRWEKLRLDLIGRKLVDGNPFRDILLVNLKPAHIAAWRDGRLRDGVAGSSVSREMSLLSHALQVARSEWGWLVTDPMKEVRRPPDNPPRERLVAPAEIEAVLAAAAACGALVATVRSQFADAEAAQTVVSQCHFDGRQYSAGSIVKMSDGLARECLEAVGGRSLKWSELSLRPI